MVFIRSVTSNAKDIADLSRPKADADPDKIFTHCGIVFRETDKDEWKVYEGRGRNGQDPLGLAKWQEAEGEGKVQHNVYVRRLADRSVLTVDVLKAMEAKASALHHTSYDFAFIWTTDNFVYCSELIWKAYAAALGKNVLKEIHAIGGYFEGLPKERVAGMIEKLKSTKARKCWPKEKKDFDAKEKAITPEEIYDSPGLVSVTDDSL